MSPQSPQSPQTTRTNPEAARSPGISFSKSLSIFGAAAVLLYLETHFLIPRLSGATGLEPVIWWFVVAGLGLFLPLLILAGVMLSYEGFPLDRTTWTTRLRFRIMNAADWKWTIAGIVVIGALSGLIMIFTEMVAGRFETTPPFMQLAPLSPGRYWILLIWLPYWLLNIMGEEILWRGVILPRQQQTLGSGAWMLHGLLWGLFHLAFGWQLLLTLLPILFVLPYIVQRRGNTWVGVAIHAIINGPSFIAISMGWM